MENLKIVNMSVPDGGYTDFCIYRLYPWQYSAVKDWCVDNFGDVILKQYNYESHIWGININGTGFTGHNYHIWFNRKEDAILFKMTWS